MYVALRQKIRHGIWVSILLLGYMAILCSHIFIMPNKFGETVVLNTEFVYGLFKNKPAGANTLVKSSQLNNKHRLHLRINKHFDTEKSVFTLPVIARPLLIYVRLPKPLYYYSNHFVSTFLYAGVGRAPPSLA